MKEKFLPIGTVCKLSTSPKEVMIIGYLPIPNEENNIVYDYSACTYPEGLLSSDLIVGFNHSEIEKILQLGMESELYNEYNKLIKEEIKKNNINSNGVTVSSIETLGI